MKSNYMNYTRFGGSKQMNCNGNNDPLTYCLAQTPDKNFQNSPYGIFLGPESRSCQLYMGDRCAKNWDGFCQYMYDEYKNPGSFPNNRVRPDLFSSRPFNQVSSGTIGDQFLNNVLQQKYCQFPNCIKKCEPFNYLDPDSPKVSYYINPNGTRCVPVCNMVDPKTVDSDPVMNLALANVNACSDTLINICNTSRNQGIDLTGTRLGSVCSKYFDNMNKLGN
jgi:hypothetical protein